MYVNWVMDAKLTLKLKSSVIEKAKAYAKEHGTSLSALVENYFEIITKDHQSVKADSISPFVKSLGGAPLPENFDERQSYRDYIHQKHA